MQIYNIILYESKAITKLERFEVVMVYRSESPLSMNILREIRFYNLNV